jgi:CheY-like chemotaxis protein
MEPVLLNILVIDDDEEDYLILRNMLCDFKLIVCGFRWASTYQEGLQALREDSWDAVLVDYDLGAHTGLELIRHALAWGFRAPLIMLTGQDKTELGNRARQAGAADILSKSVMDADELERIVRVSVLVEA